MIFPGPLGAGERRPKASKAGPFPGSGEVKSARMYGGPAPSGEVAHG
jgi:hypothetical protein